MPTAWSVRLSRVALILCRKPKRKTARVESISAYIGRSTKTKAFPKAARLRIMSLITASHRCTRQIVGCKRRSGVEPRLGERDSAILLALRLGTKGLGRPAKAVRTA